MPLVLRDSPPLSDTTSTDDESCFVMCKPATTLKSISTIARKARDLGRIHKVPCITCIARVSERQGNHVGIQLCKNCLMSLRLADRRQSSRNGQAARKLLQNQGPGLDSLPKPQIQLWSTNQKEQHAVQFFVQHSAPELSGYFDSAFWERMVLQAGRHEPAVRHVLAAIGSLHEKLLIGAVYPDETKDERTTFALEQCNSAIRYLTKPTKSGSSPDPRLVLTTCVLFACFEALQGHCEQGSMHATQGITLFRQFASAHGGAVWDNHTFAIELDQMSAIMKRMDMQSKALMGNRLRSTFDAKPMLPDKLPIPTAFSSLGEARAGLEVGMSTLANFLAYLGAEAAEHRFYDVVVANAEKHLVLRPWLDEWERVFSEFLDKHSASLSARDRKGAMVLKAYHIVAEIVCDIDLSLGEMAWDSCHDKFAAVLDLATAILEGSKQADVSVIEARWKSSGVFISAPSATLSFSLDIVDPLYQVCACCRDPVLRRKALDLLARYPRQDVMWSSWSAWKLGKFIMRVEEESAPITPVRAADIPIDSRIAQAWFDFSNKSSVQSARGLVAYLKAVPQSG